MAPKELTQKEIRALIPAARARERIAARTQPRAKSAKYNPATRRIEVELRNGGSFGFPPGLPGLGLADASPAQLAAVRVDRSGEGLHWEELDADVSIPGIVELLFGSSVIMIAAARRAGSVRSPRKARSSRENGALGGRPRGTRKAS